MKPAIISIAKREHNYIIEFVNYHLALGFDTIFIYDNEEIPTYKNILKDFGDYVVVIHLPLREQPQIHAILDFMKNIAFKYNITHAAHIDIDEFIVLKKHRNINDFIREYIQGDCAGIGISWKFFGDNNLKKVENNNFSVIERFIKGGNPNPEKTIEIKTLFDVTKFNRWATGHYIISKPNTYIKNTNHKILKGPHNIPEYSVIQLNHYKCKTLEEFKYISKRGRSDLPRSSKGNMCLENSTDKVIINMHNRCNINIEEDLYAYNFYNKYVKTWKPNIYHLTRFTPQNPTKKQWSMKF